MSNDVEILTIDHFEEIKELMKIRREHYPSFDWSEQRILNYFKDDNYQLYGSIQNGQLQSTLGVCYWKSMPYTTLLTMMTRMNSNAIFNIDKSGIQGCFETILTNAEARGYYTHYSVRSIRELRVEYKRNVWKPFEDRNPRWVGYNEAFIPADTKPEFATWWKIMGQQLHGWDTMIYSVRLRNEYRFNDVFPDISPEILALA